MKSLHVSGPIATLSKCFLTEQTLKRSKSEVNVAHVDGEFDKILVTQFAVVAGVRVFLGGR